MQFNWEPVGGTMDDVLKRLGNVESAVAALTADVIAIKAVVPHHPTEARLSALEDSLTAKISAFETSIIKWLVGGIISSSAIAFACAKFVS
jgi:hypothetical protein